MSHTKGPWLIAGEDKTFVYALGQSGTNCFWAHVQAAGAERAGDDEKAANARLIAAAPELLEALRRCHQWLQGSEPHRATYIGEVIAKATGEQA